MPPSGTLGPVSLPTRSLCTSQDLGQLVQSTSATSIQRFAAVIKALAVTNITGRYDFSSVEIIQIGGAPFTADLLNCLFSRGRWKFSVLYGMTEAAPYVSWQKLGEQAPKGAVEKLLPNIESLLRKEGSTEDAPEGGPGELWIRGSNLARGYASVDTSSAKPLADADGWYNTGDVCAISEEGFLSLVGRTKELINFKGFKVSPMELAALVAEHPLVLATAVGAVRDEEQLTELPAAYVVLKDVEADVRKKADALTSPPRY